MLAADVVLSAGSPPHTRGKPPVHPALKLSFRITPAYAGKTRIISRTSAAHSDHPRIRGENSIRYHPPFDSRESPSHTRGKQARAGKSQPDLRITPAYVGKTSASILPCNLSEDHPRIRGENCMPQLRKRAQRGSPPHTRGKHLSEPLGIGLISTISTQIL